MHLSSVRGAILDKTFTAILLANPDHQTFWWHWPKSQASGTIWPLGIIVYNKIEFIPFFQSTRECTKALQRKYVLIFDGCYGILPAFHDRISINVTAKYLYGIVATNSIDHQFAFDTIWFFIWFGTTQRQKPHGNKKKLHTIDFWLKLRILIQFIQGET